MHVPPSRCAADRQHGGRRGDSDRAAVGRHRGAARRCRRPGARGGVRGRAAREHRHDDGQLLAAPRAHRRFDLSCVPKRGARVAGTAPATWFGGSTTARLSSSDAAIIRSSCVGTGSSSRRSSLWSPRSQGSMRAPCWWSAATKTGSSPSSPPPPTTTSVHRCWLSCADVCRGIRCQQKSWVSRPSHVPGSERSTVLRPRHCSPMSDGSVSPPSHHPSCSGRLPLFVRPTMTDAA